MVYIDAALASNNPKLCKRNLLVGRQRRKYWKKYSSKVHIFEEATKTKKHIFLSMITTFGLVQNEHKLGLVDQELTLDHLFT